jgi:methylamine dehydrogenase accessory protein MauD
VLATSGLFYASYAAMWILLATLSVLMLLLYRHFGLMTMGTMEGVQRDGLAVGEAAPPVSLTREDGATEELAADPSRPTLVVFAATTCAPCEVVMPFVNDLGHAANDGLIRLRIASIVAGPPEEAGRFVAKYAPPFSAYAEDGVGVFRLYRVRVTPFAFVLGEDGRVRSKGLCSNIGNLRHLLWSAGLDDVVDVLEGRGSSPSAESAAPDEAATRLEVPT